MFHYASAEGASEKFWEIMKKIYAIDKSVAFVITFCISNSMTNWTINRPPPYSVCISRSQRIRIDLGDHQFEAQKIGNSGKSGNFSCLYVMDLYNSFHFWSETWHVRLSLILLPRFGSFIYKIEKVKRKLKILIQNNTFRDRFDCTIWTVFMCEFEMIPMQYGAQCLFASFLITDFLLRHTFLWSTI